MSQKFVAITTSTFAEFDQRPLQALKKGGFKYKLNPYRRTMSSDEFVGFVKDAVGVVAGTEKIDGSALSRVSGLKVISRCGVGMDNVDLAEAKMRGIKVLNTPDAPTIAVAELVIGFILSLLRQTSTLNNEVHQGRWPKKMGGLFAGKTVGIIGMGRIGQAVAKLSLAFGAKVVYFDPFVKLKGNKFQSTNLDELLKTSDIVSLHVSYSKDNQYLIAKKQLKMMKREAILINCSRGGVVNETDLLEALNSKQIGGVALDVFEKEPYDGPLKGKDNVILTPHIGSYAKEARIQMEIEAVENLILALGDKKNNNHSRRGKI